MRSWPMRACAAYTLGKDLACSIPLMMLADDPNTNSTCKNRAAGLHCGMLTQRRSTI